MAAAASHGLDVPPPRRDVIVIGASAGGVEALQKLVAGLPDRLPAAVLVVLHVLAGGRSLLADILARAGRLPAAQARDGVLLEHGRIYVAPPDYHLVLQGDTLRLIRGPRENGHRPAIDLLFRSAAQSRGRRAIGIVLSGLLDDGAAGLRDIKEHGGVALVQAPDDALFPAMPRNAMAATDVDAVLPIDELPAMIGRLLSEDLAPVAVTATAVTATAVTAPGVDAGREAGPPDRLDLAGVGPTTGRAGHDVGALSDPEAAPSVIALLEGEATALTCPECGGALWEWRDGALQRFSCHVGHTFSGESMLDGQARALESALWGALRAREERSDLLRRLARASSGITRRNLELRAQKAGKQADQLRETLQAAGGESADDIDLNARTRH